MQRTFLGYRCSLCSTEYLPDEITYTCPHDGGNLDVVLDYEMIKRKGAENLVDQSEESIWRYLSLLPLKDPGAEGTPLHAVGWTPQYSPRTLKDNLGLRNLWLKDESRNPTASFKDRASAVVIARAREIGVEVVVTASTGNAGAALAGMAAAVNHKAVIFAPRAAPQAKIAQLLVYGASVILVDGSYDEAFDLSIQAAHEFGWYCRNTGYNPFTAEGKKTAAFEIWEWYKRDYKEASPINKLKVFVSVGDGNIISGLHKGFKDLKILGLLDEMPRIYGVQAEGSAAIANAFNAGDEDIIPVTADTLADSISVDLPRDGVRAVRAVRQTGGRYIMVSDDDILNAITSLGKAGIFAEPAGAASYAGLVSFMKNNQIEPDDAVVVFNTGSGLKDVNAAMRAVKEAPVIAPSLNEVKRVLRI